MYKLDEYIGKSSGDGIKVAIIDSGIKTKQNNIMHYVVSEGKIKEVEESTISDYHGTYCALQLLQVAPNVIIYDLNIINERKELTLEYLLTALKFCINEKVDIINISLKFENQNDDLYEICKTAFQNNILIIAASDGALSFPADYEYVIKVKSIDSDEEIIISDYIGIKNRRFSCVIDNKEYIIPPSSSLSTAYVTGCIALIMENNPLLTSTDIYYSIMGKNIGKKEKVHYDFSIPANSIIVMHSVIDMDILEYVEDINSNIIGYYNSLSNEFVSFDNSKLKENEIENVIEINSTERVRVSTLNRKEFSNYNKYIIGKFENVPEGVYEIKAQTHNMANRKKYIVQNKIPAICFAGFGYSSNKFMTQLALYKNLKRMDINVECMTYNPLGFLFDFKVMQYPESIKFPDIVYSINNEFDYLFKKNMNTDIILMNTAGGISEFNIFNDNNFGALFDAYIKAVDIDIVILCVNLSVNSSKIKNEIEIIKSKGIPYVFITLSKLCYENSSLIRSNGLQYCISENKERDRYYNELQKEIGADTLIFTYDNQSMEEMTKTILNLYK